MGEKNIGGYDENYKYDSLAVNYLEGRILKSKYLIPHISSGDKVPNLDGSIELCEDAVNKINPIAKFEVQVKSLNHDYTIVISGIIHNIHINTPVKQNV